MNYNYIYQPTPMEEAYAYYLIRTVFPNGIICSDNNSNSSGGSSGGGGIIENHTNTTTGSTKIHIKGKYMVPFLSKASSSSSSSSSSYPSNDDDDNNHHTKNHTVTITRDTLRHIWNLVDPQSYGYITSIRPQFITILRYISILQQQPLPQTATTTMTTNPINGSSSNSNTNTNNTDWLQQCLYDTANRTDLPLAQFDGYPIPQPRTLLLYMNTTNNNNNNNNNISAMKKEDEKNNNNNNDDDVDDDFGDFNDSTVTASQQQQQQQAAVFGTCSTGTTDDDTTTPPLPTTTLTATATTRTDAFDAFDALSIIDIAPLPMLPPACSTTTTVVHSLPPFLTAVTTTDVDAATTAERPQLLSSSLLPSTTATNTVQMVDSNDDNDNDEDDFGDFLGTTASSTVAAITNNSSTIQQQQQQQQPSDIAAATTTTAETESHGFGDFQTTTTTIPAIQDDGWGALDALVEAKDTPLPSLLSLYPPSSTILSMTDLTTNHDNDTVDRTFSNNTITSCITNGTKMQYETDAVVDRFASSSSFVETTTNDSPTIISVIEEKISDGFGDCRSPNHNDNTTIATIRTISSQPGSTSIDDSAVVDITVEQQYESGWDALDALSSSSSQLPILPLPINQIGSTATAVVRDENAEFVSAIDHSNYNATVTMDSNNRALTNSYGAATVIADILSVHQHPDHIPSASEQGQEQSSYESGWNALDALAASTAISSDITVPPLQSLDHDIMREAATLTQEESESEGFGEFVSPQDDTTSMNTGMTQLPVVVRGDVDAMTTATTIDVPLQSDSNIISRTTLEKHPNYESGWDAIDALAATERSNRDISKQPPLQSLNDYMVEIDKTTQAKSESEGFGDFVSPQNNVLLRTMTQPPEVVGDMPTITSTDTVTVSTKADESTISTTEQQQRQPSYESGWDALDALALTVTSETVVPPLQNSLYHDVVTVKVDEEESDSFGDFTGMTDLTTIDVFNGATENVSGPTEVQAVSEPFITASNTAMADNQLNDIPNEMTLNGVEFDSGVAAIRNDKSGWDALDELNIVANAPLPSLTEFSLDPIDNESDIKPNEDDEDISDGFGDFIGDEGATSKSENTFPSSENVLQREPTQTDTNNDPFDVHILSAQTTLPRPTITYDRADSSYYSAQARSISSDSDINNYEDATMNGSEVDTATSEIICIDATNVNLNGGLAFFSSSTTVDNADPFSILSSDATAQPSIPNIFISSEGNMVEDNNTNDFDAFTDFSGISDVDVGVTVGKEVANDMFLPSNAIEGPHNGVKANLIDIVVDDDDFGDFETVTNTDVMKRNLTISDETDSNSISNDNFGSFDDFRAFETSGPTNAPILAKDDNVLPQNRQIEVGLVVECDADWIWTREQIILKSNSLPEKLRQALHRHIDFGLCFDTNIGRKFPLSESRIHQIIRCASLMDRLSSSHGQELAKYWVEVLSVIKKEMSNGTLVLQDAVSLDQGDVVFVSKQLKKYVYSLKEFVRVSRWIIATVADLLMLDVFTMLSDQTLSASFLSSELAIEVHEIEKYWDKILMYDERLVLGVMEYNSSSNRLEDLVEIRSRLFDSAIDSALCDFTLQPLPNPIKIDTTQNVIIWSESTYLLCTANLLSNKTDYFTRKSRRVLI